MNELMIYSDIGEDMFGDGISAASIKSQLDSMEGDIKIRINSPGGDVFDGFAIYNLINSHEGKKTVYIDGLAASAASIVAMAGDEIVMADNALMMIHDPWTMSLGNSADMRDTADLLDKVKGSILTVYDKKSSMTPEEISDLMTKETWFTAKEAIDAGFATKSGDSHATVTNINKRWIKNAPPAEKIQKDEETQVMWRIALNKRRMMTI